MPNLILDPRAKEIRFALYDVVDRVLDEGFTYRQIAEVLENQAELYRGIHQDLLARMSYREYLHTVDWQERRAERLKLAGYRCELCNSDERLNVHHRTYVRRGAEEVTDLIVLCRPCHAKFHDREP